MAFTGVAVFKKVTDTKVRVTGLSLAPGAQGLIALASASAPAPGSVILPANPTVNWTPYDDVTLIDAIQVVINPASDVVNFAIPIRVTKSGGVDSFSVALENDAAAVASADLEIYVEFH